MLHDSSNSGFEQGNGCRLQDSSAGTYREIAAQAYINDLPYAEIDPSISGMGTEDFPNLSIDEYPVSRTLDTEPKIGAGSPQLALTCQ